jgi:hypothetical protein
MGMIPQAVLDPAAGREEPVELLEEDIAELEAASTIRFDRLVTIVEHHFARTKAGGKGSHIIFKTPWPGDPRINLQRDSGGQAKKYQIRQVLAALRKLQSLRKQPSGGVK